MSGAAAPTIFGTDGIRGEAGRGWLAPTSVERLGQALGGRLGSGATVALARDTRISGSELVGALTRGLERAGCDVIDLGVAPTPALAAAILDLGVAGGAMVSASHNPPADNGIKLFNQAATKLPESDELEIEAELRWEHQLPEDASRPGTSRALAAESVQAAYEAHLHRHLMDLAGELPRLDDLHLAVDCAEGAASAVAPPILMRLGARVEAMASDGDGARINVECGALHPEVVARRVVELGADLGLAFDGDADRIILADESGQVRHGDAIMWVLACDLLERGRLAGGAVVGTVMTNLGLELALERRGIELMRTPVGDRHVTAALQERGLILGGEQAGHIVLRGVPPLVGDGLLVALHVLEVMQRRERTLDELCEGLELFPQVISNVPVTSRRPLDELPGVGAAVIAAEERLQGRGRVLLRYSGTELKCRVMVEAEPGQPVDEIAATISDAVRAAS